MRTSGTVHDGRVRNYLSQPGDCKACELKARCTRAPFRKIARDINEEARDYARSLKGTPEFEQSSDERKKVEMRFAHLKVQHRFERMPVCADPGRSLGTRCRARKRRRNRKRRKSRRSQSTGAGIERTESAIEARAHGDLPPAA